MPPWLSYRVFGLDVWSERPIAGLVPRDDVTNPDVRVRFGRGPAAHRPHGDWTSAPFYVSPFEDASGRPLGIAWDIDDGAYVRFLLRDGAEFLVDRSGSEVWVHAPAASDGATAEYLIGPVFGITLRRRDIVSLHASVVCLEDRAVTFLGPEGSGKSTLAALFAMRGYAVVTDDLAALVDCGKEMLVQPGAPYVRARRGAIETAAEALGRRSDLVPSPDGRYLDLDLVQPRYRAVAAPSVLAAIYVLESTAASSAQSRTGPVIGAEAVMTLLGNTWATRLPAPDRRVAELDFLTRIVSHIPMTRIPVDQTARNPCALADEIASDFARKCRSRSA